MKLTETDKQILKDLCEQHKINFEKILKLIQIEQDYQQKGNRVGIYDALKEVIKQN